MSSEADAMESTNNAAFDDLRGKIRAFFAEDSPLRHAPEHGGRPYEPRPQQLAMAEAFVDAMAAGRHLFAEAPTGVGKSFAYLVPAILLTRLTDKPVVISTHTIALQEQLIQKDIPLLQKLLDLPFSAALAKGRENYVCIHRLNKCHQQGQGLLSGMDLPEVLQIAQWAQTTKDGSRADLDFKPHHQVWSSVCSDPDICPCNDEAEQQQCFFTRARRKLFAADIIVANHALLCTDFAMRRDSRERQGILPDYCALIIDEAHTFEEVAATHLGLRVSSYGILALLNRLYQKRSLQGLLARPDGEPARAEVLRTYSEAEHFFNRLRTWLEEQAENPLPYEHAGHVPNLLAEPLTNLYNCLTRLSRQAELDAEFRRELAGVANRLADARDKLDIFLNMSQPDSVYWFERYGRERNYISMNAVPIAIGDILKDILFNQDFTVVLTSATMAVDARLDYFKERLGSPDANSLILDSPFNYREQVDLYLPMSDDIGDPKRDPEGFMESCCHYIRKFIAQTGGKAFVLFTNYQQMNEAAELLRSFFEENRIHLMVQGQELQRTRMLETFRDDVSSVIFGTSSFWMGVDVPGEALSNVIIVRLPFPVPSHPRVRAICKRLDERGISSFRHYSLPEAVLRFRQGFGRLIRSRDDRGIVVILDPRVVSSNYGKVFLSSIPDCRRQIF